MNDSATVGDRRLWREVVVEKQLERDEVLRGATSRAEAGEDAELVARLLAARFSCRAFRPDPVPEADILRLLNAAQLSASWCNTQPWQVTITSGAGTERFREAVFEHASNNPPRVADFDLPSYEGVYRDRRRSAGWRLYESVGIGRGDRKASFLQALENYKFFGAPHVMIITTDRELGTYGAIDCGIFLGNLMLVAQAMGIDTIPQAAFAFIAPFVSEYFDFPPDRKVICGLSFGYRDAEGPVNKFRTPRAPIENVLTWAKD